MDPNYCHIINSEFWSLFTYEHFQFEYMYIPSSPLTLQTCIRGLLSQEREGCRGSDITWSTRLYHHALLKILSILNFD